MSRITDQYKDPTYLRTQMVQDDQGIYRWISNGSVPPSEIVHSLGLCTRDELRHTQARGYDLAAFAVEYRKCQAERTPEQIAEQRAEARAAMGPGVKLVNVISGETYTT
jgi:hypothetical protein